MRADYDLIVIGGGMGAARRRGAQLLLVQAGRIGGECTFTGCVPSKALIAAAENGKTWDDALSQENGIVADHAEDCIGCQYCIWNCPYQVPVFNPKRRVVTECDLCQPRLAAGGAPACVEACPTEAIKVGKSGRGGMAPRPSRGGRARPSPLRHHAVHDAHHPLRVAAAQTRSVVDERLEPADPHRPWSQ